VKANWQIKPIGDVFKVVNGGTPKTGVASNWDGPHAWITPAEMGNLETPFISESRRTLTDEGLRTGAELVPAGSIILSSRAPIGHLVINEIPMAFNQGCKGLIPSPAIDTKFAYYFLLTNVPLLESLGTGATFKELSGGKLKEVPFLFPELGEQRRIVTLLDETFADIGTAKANAEKNLQNARELFSSFVQSLFMTKEDGWFQTTIGEQLQLQRGFDITKDQQTEGTVPVVSSGGIKSYHDTSMVDGPGVVIGRKGTLGKSFFLETSFWPHDTTLWVKDFKGNEPKLVYHLLSSLDLKKLDSGAANPALNRNQVHPLKIWWPDRTNQSDLIAIIDSMSGETARLHEIYRQKLTALDDLKKSLLHQAFSGQLTQ
jgi:type I restriction enzyme S subunit